MALTATANEQAVADVMSKLGIQDCLLLSQSFNRLNLHYAVRDKKGLNVAEDISKWIQGKHKGECGIIYCLSRNECETLAKKLRDQFHLSVKHYHAGMAPNDKHRTHQEWQTGVCNIIVATVRILCFEIVASPIQRCLFI